MERPKRKPNRLREYDYSQNGACFVTICTQDRKKILSTIVGTPVIARFVGTFKRFRNKEYGENIWRSRYYDHVIRNQEDYDEIWQYIENNPRKWLLQRQGE